MRYAANSPMISVNNQTGAEHLGGFLEWFDRRCHEALNPKVKPLPIRPEEARLIAAKARARGELVVLPPPRPAYHRRGRTRHPRVLAAMQEFIATHGLEPNRSAHLGVAASLARKHRVALTALNSALTDARARRTSHHPAAA